jgi:uncharacterized Zn finger protein (UPF0148 family)
MLNVSRKWNRISYATQIKVSDLEKNPEVACPKCGLTTNIEADELKKMRETINQAAEKFKDALRRRSK